MKLSRVLISKKKFKSHEVEILKKKCIKIWENPKPQKAQPPYPYLYVNSNDFFCIIFLPL